MALVLRTIIFSTLSAYNKNSDKNVRYVQT